MENKVYRYGALFLISITKIQNIIDFVFNRANEFTTMKTENAIFIPVSKLLQANLEPSAFLPSKS